MNPQRGTDSRSFRWGFAALLAALATIGPFSVDTYLPAFEGIEASLDTTLVGMQQTLSAYLFAFGVMFLFHGAISDSVGRRPVILVSLVVYTLGSIGCALATNIEALIFWRVVQGLSVGAGMVVGRAMIRDVFEPVEAQRLMSLVTLFFGLAPAVAPIIGGLLFASLGWRSIFWFLVIVGVLLVAMSLRFLKETLPEDSRQPFHPRALFAGYREVSMSPRFVWLAMAVGFNFNALFLYIVSAPVFLGDHLKLGPQEYAWLFIPSILGIMTGAQLSGYAAGKLLPQQTVKRAYAFMAIAALGNLAANWLAAPSIPWSMAPIFVYGIGTAMAMPSITLLALDLFPTRRGMAASLQSFGAGMVNTLTAGAISLAVSHDPLWLAIAMVIMMGIGVGAWAMYVRSAQRHAEPPTVIRI